MVISRHMVITKVDYLTKWLKQFTGISIHTVLTEGDDSQCPKNSILLNFNPHLPHRR